MLLKSASDITLYLRYLLCANTFNTLFLSGSPKLGTALGVRLFWTRSVDMLSLYMNFKKRWTRAGSVYAGDSKIK